MKAKYQFILIGLICITIFACNKKEEEPNLTGTSYGGPNLPAQTYNYLENQLLNPLNFSFEIELTNHTITLGRVLFYDKALSFNNSISCGSCHFQDKGFANNVKFDKGVFGNSLKRNTMSITGNGNSMFWDGRANNMKDLVLRPISNHDEMVQDAEVLVTKIKQIGYYKDLFNKAYNSDEIDLKRIENALAAFCISLLPSHSKFDDGVASLVTNGFSLINVDSTTQLFTLNATENKGLNLFFGKARCATCHHPDQVGPTYGSFSSSTFANIGLDLVYNDNGVGSLSSINSLNGAFKIPNLKNVALTAPYMHDGRFNTLEEVVEHYNSGIKANANLSPKLFKNFVGDPDLGFFEDENLPQNIGPVEPVRLGLTPDEKAALVAFLKTFTDEKLAKDIKFSNPF
jgi:cytochrome c peroxidase